MALTIARIVSTVISHNTTPKCCMPIASYCDAVSFLTSVLLALPLILFVMTWDCYLVSCIVMAMMLTIVSIIIAPSVLSTILVLFLLATLLPPHDVACTARGEVFAL